MAFQALNVLRNNPSWQSRFSGCRLVRKKLTESFGIRRLIAGIYTEPLPEQVNSNSPSHSPLLKDPLLHYLALYGHVFQIFSLFKISN